MRIETEALRTSGFEQRLSRATVALLEQAAGIIGRIDFHGN